MAIAKVEAVGIRARLRSLRARLGEMWWYTLLMFLVQGMGYVVNIFIGLVLVPRFVPTEDLGAVTPLMSVAAFVGFPIAVALLPVGKFLNVFAARGEYGRVKALLVDAVALSLAFAVGVAVWLFASGDGILERLHVSDRRVFIPIAGFAMLTCVDPIVQTAQRALKCFRGMMVAGLAAPYVRLAGMLLLLPAFGAFGYLSAQMTMSLVCFLIGVAVLWRVMRGLGPRQSYWPAWREMLAYSLPLLAMTLAGRVQMPVESFVIRHRLPADVTAGYYFASLFGAIPGYFVSVVTIVLWPVVSDRFERGQPTDALQRQSMLFTFLVGTTVLAATAAVAPLVFRLHGPWKAYSDYSSFIWQVGLLNVLKNMQATFTTSESACRRFRYVRYLVPPYLLESAVLYSLPAWGALRPYVPDGLWRYVDTRWTLSLQSFVTLLIVFNGAFVAAMLIDWALAARARRRTAGALPPRDARAGVAQIAKKN